jgi:azurin
MKDGRNRSIAARALTQLPKDAWSREEAAPVVESIISWGKSVPEKSRTGQDYVETLQVGQELAALLPPESANGLRRQLRALGVPVFVIKTVHEQMRYDTPRIVVEPGKPLEVIFENLDAMPHNIVFVTPGARESLATAAQTMSPTKLDKKGRAYVPAGEKVLEASKIIEPGQKQTLKFSAPQKPGEYEYVCTFPGHWMIMWGKMVVTPDVDKYLNEKSTTAAVNPAGQILKP